MTTGDDRLAGHFRVIDLDWSDFDEVDWDAVLRAKAGESYLRAASHYLRTGLVRKGTLLHCLRTAEKCGQSLGASYLPAGSACFDVEDADDVEMVVRALRSSVAGGLGPDNLWILKASKANRGEDLYVVGDEDEVRRVLCPKRGGDEAAAPVSRGVASDGRPAVAMAGNEEGGAAEGDGSEPPVEWVAQRYLVPPTLALVGSRKFHLRVHVVVDGCPHCGRLGVYVHQEPLVLAASKVYPSSSSSEGKDGKATKTALAIKRVGKKHRHQIFVI